MSLTLPQGMTITGAIEPGFERILTLPALELVARLHRAFEPRRQTLLAARVERATVIGAGVMGGGIAQWLAARGVSVMLRDINAEAVARGLAGVGKLFADGVKRRTFTPVEARAAMDRISPVVELPVLRRADVVIEAAVEKMDLKKDIFRKLEQLAGPDTILATNTSALSVTELAESLSAPERVVGIHFFNPVHRMQLVEVIHTPRTDAEVVRRALRFVQQMGKLPVLVKDSPGFVVNRVLMPYLVEAARLFEVLYDHDDMRASFGKGYVGRAHVGALDLYRVLEGAAQGLQVALAGDEHALRRALPAGDGQQLGPQGLQALAGLGRDGDMLALPWVLTVSRAFVHLVVHMQQHGALRQAGEDGLVGAVVGCVTQAREVVQEEHGVGVADGGP